MVGGSIAFQRTTTGFDAVPWRPLEEVERSVTFRFVFRREVYYRHWIVVLIEEKKENEMFLRVSFSLCTIIYRKIILNNSKISSLLRQAWQVSAKMKNEKRRRLRQSH